MELQLWAIMHSSKFKSINNIIMKNKIYSQVLVAHACNPSYSGGRDQEDCGSKPARAK
jgi:hypothetical protein